MDDYLLYEAEPTDEYFEYGQTRDKSLDDNTIMFIRSAKIWNPQLNNMSPTTTNLLEVKSAVNENNGKVLLSLDTAGYISPRQSDMTNYKDINYNPEERTLDEVQNNSNEEKVPLTHPFIWVGQDTWAGINYLPPLNSEVIIGFGRRHNAYILGYLNPSYKSCKPYLKPGEICIKGAGNNYIHTRWSNKLDLKAWASTGDQDKDAASREEQAKSNCELWIRMDADNGSITLSAQGGANGQFSAIIITPDGIQMTSGGKSVQELRGDGSITTTSGKQQTAAGNQSKDSANISDNG
jgi:hypothetical protein